MILLKKNEKDQHDSIVKSAETLLNLYEELNEEKLPNKIHQLKQKIEHVKEKIDESIFGLYELTEEEIKAIQETK